MAFNFSLNFGYLVQTGVYNHNAESMPAAEPATVNVSGNISITLYPSWYKHVRVEWSVPADWGNCQFNVYFSPSQIGPFQKLTSSPITGNYLEDDETEEFSKFNRGYYVVEAILLDQGSARIKSSPASWETGQRRWVELRSIEVQRREYILLRKFVGVKSYVFKKRAYGERCPECWNHASEKAIKDNCNTCYGTTFKGGYFGPTPTYYQYDATANSNMKTYFGTFEPDQIGAWSISFPEVEPDDIIVRTGDWSTYRVDRVIPTELQGQTVKQMAQLTRLPKSNIEYMLIRDKITEFKK